MYVRDSRYYFENFLALSDNFALVELLRYDLQDLVVY